MKSARAAIPRPQPTTCRIATAVETSAHDHVSIRTARLRILLQLIYTQSAADASYRKLRLRFRPFTQPHSIADRIAVLPSARPASQQGVSVLFPNVRPTSSLNHCMNRRPQIPDRAHIFCITANRARSQMHRSRPLHACGTCDHIENEKSEVRVVRSTDCTPPFVSLGQDSGVRKKVPTFLPVPTDRDKVSSGLISYSVQPTVQT